MAWATGVSGCLLYTDPINQPPVIDEIVGSDTIERGKTEQFTARAHDDDQGDRAPELAWRVRKGACAASLDDASGAPDGAGPVFAFKHDVKEPVCLWVVATDDQGASASKAKQVLVGNQPPVATLQVISSAPGPDGKYELYSSFRVRVTVTDPENDPPTWMATLTRPKGEGKLPPCADGKDDGCFDADVPGQYTVTVNATDGQDAAKPVSKQVMVAADRPPCLTPAPAADFRSIHAPGDTVTFSVVADDDGDPYPPRGVRPGAMSQFVWWIDPTGTGVFKLRGGLQLSELQLRANEYRPGDVVHVRVQYLDSFDLATGRDYSACDKMPLSSCALRPGCYQRIVWTVEYR